MRKISVPLLAVFLLGSIFMTVALLRAQQPAGDEGPLIKVDVNVVNVLCTVRNKANGLVGNLEKSDFTIFEDGKQQTITNFTRDTDLPLTMALLVDVSESQERLIDVERRAAHDFFTHVLRKKDEAFLISFGAEAELLQDSTNSPELLLDGLNQLRLSVPVTGLHPGPVPTMQHLAGTILYDAVYLAANEKLKGEVGRKAIIVITDGVDTGSKITRDQSIESAQRADSIIYSIFYQDAAAYGAFRRRRRRLWGVAAHVRPTPEGACSESTARYIARRRVPGSSGRNAQPILDFLYADEFQARRHVPQNRAARVEQGIQNSDPQRVLRGGEGPVKG